MTNHQVFCSFKSNLSFIHSFVHFCYFLLLTLNILSKTYLDFILFHEFCQEPNLPISSLRE